MNVCGVSMCFVNVHFRAHHENYVGRLVVSTFLFTRKTVCYVSLLNVIAKAAVVLWWWVWDWTDADREFVVVEPATWVTSEDWTTQCVLKLHGVVRQSVDMLLSHTTFYLILVKFCRILELLCRCLSNSLMLGFSFSREPLLLYPTWRRSFLVPLL